MAFRRKMTYIFRVTGQRPPFWPVGTTLGSDRGVKLTEAFMAVVARCMAGPGVLSLALALVLFVGVPASSVAQPGGSALSRARAAYSTRQYEQVVTLLRPMLYPISKLTTEAEEVEAYKLLGISHYWLSLLKKQPAEKKLHKKQAERQFSALLTLRPTFRLAKLRYTGHLRKFFEGVRKKLKAAASPLKALEAELNFCRKKTHLLSKRFRTYRDKCQSQVLITQRVEKRYYFWNFVPFGAGQFQNGHKLKGALFAVSQGAMLALNITALILGETTFVRNGPNRTVLKDQKSRARAADIQKLTIASGTLFWSLVLWGIIDAVVFYKKTTVIKQRKLIPLGPNVGLTPSVGKDSLVLSLEARF